MSSSRPTWFPRWLSSVRAVMILLISLATIFPLGIILYQGLQHRSQAYRDSRILTERVATEIVSDQQLLLSSAEQLFSTFSYIPAIRRRDAVAVNALLADLVRKNPQITNLLVADEKGNTWASGLPMKGAINASDRQYFRNAKETGRFSSGEFTIGRLLYKPTLLFGYPLRDGSGRITDVATVSFTLNKYERYFQTKGLATDVSLALFDRKGTILYSRPTLALVGKQDREDLFRKMTAGPDEGTFEAVGLTGVKRVFTYRKLRLPGESQPYMYVRAGISVSSILDRTEKDFLFGMGSIAVAAILILLSSVLLSKRFVLDKVAALRVATERISRGDLGARVPEIVSGGELGELGNAFDNMASRLQEADTERRGAEETLRASRKMIEEIINAIPVRVFWKDRDLIYLGCNSIFARDAGFTDPKDVIGKDDCRMGWREQAELYRADDRQVIESGCSKFLIEESLTTSEGNTITLLTSKIPLHDSNGEIVGVLGTSYDITDRKFAEAEKERLQAQLQQAMKMEAVGRLAGGVAHDFNNLLTVITGYSELLLQKIGEESPMHREVEEIRRAGERAASLTQQLLAFSRKQIIEPKVLHLGGLVAEMHTMLTRLIGEDIALQATTGKALGSVKVDPGQFQQILMNLVVNARDAMPDGGKIVIETANVDLDEGYCSLHPYVKPGRFVMLAVSDTGQGMSEEVKEHIFEPFFTTKERGSGTGLGLATTYGAVHQAGGSIEVSSEVGIGTTFKIYLPRVEDEAVKPVKDDRPTDHPGGTETVLIVEDEDILRNLCVQILEQLGYRVLEARSGTEAIAEVQRSGDRIDLLLTDVVMPGMNGSELAKHLVPHNPEMKVLFTSGYTEDVISHHGVLAEGVSFIGKPYTPLALARRVREVLDKA